MTQEMETINRLQNEMDQERALQQDKRKQEREYLQRMLEENDKNKLRQQAQQEKERLDDLRAQEDYAKMLDK